MRIAGMGHRAALHLNSLGIEQLMDVAAHLAIVDKLVAGGNNTLVDVHALHRRGSLDQLAAQIVVSGKTLSKAFSMRHWLL